MSPGPNAGPPKLGMELSLKSTTSKAAFALGSLLLVGLFELSSVRQYLAFRQYEQLTAPALQAAIRLDPWNSDYAHLLGRIHLYDDQDFNAARTAIEQAAALNPHNARYWLDLASVAQVTGDTQAEAAALERAERSEPTMPEVSWEVANFYLLRGDLPKAFASFGRVERYSPQLRKRAAELSWRMQPDVNVQLQYVPHTVDALSSLLQVLYEQQKFPEAATVWQNLAALHQPMDTNFARTYLSHLLSYKHPQLEQAQVVWRDLVAINPEMAEYGSTNNLVVNGNFEHDVLDWGFDWQYAKRPHVDVAQESGIFHSGSRSLSVSFDGEDIEDFGIFQYVPVKPNSRYNLQAFVRTDDVVGSSGPRLAVTSPYDFSKRFYISDDILGSSLWSAHGGNFSTGADTQMVAIVLLRDAPYTPIKGHLWLDDVTLVQEGGP